ncbi:MAG: hypothetical protein HC814_06315 [Rhodobacteraceae bacterium]|nr:hypothetical protein [Paracoccaceae bacterium]
MSENLSQFVFQLRYVFTHLSLNDGLDMALVALVFFVIFQALRQTRALQLLNGFILLFLLGGALLVALPFRALNWIVAGFLIVSLIALPYFFRMKCAASLFW